MRIGIDARLWNQTGVGRYIRNLVRQLQIIDTINQYVLFVQSEDSEDVKTHILNSRWKLIPLTLKWHSLQEQLLFPRILNKEKLDIVHFPYFSVPIFYKGRFVITIHDLIIDHYPTGKASTQHFLAYLFKKAGYHIVMQFAARKAKKIITVSHTTEKEIIGHLHVPKDRIVVTYEGVYASANLEPKVKDYFLYVGNAYPHKNLGRLIEAFRMFKGKNQTAVKLVLVGKEDYFYKKLKKDVNDMECKNDMVFMHEVKDQELSQLYQHALALVVPSLMEGFGLPALEAMANHCLVLASDIASLHEVCSDSAVYFNPKDTDDLAEKLRIVYKDITVFSEQKKKGFERSKLFSWETMVKETLNVYESCARL